MEDRAAVIIPARYGSSRFPGKVLATIQSRPLIQWVYEAVNRSKLVSRVIVATDDQKVYDTITQFGGNVAITSPRPRTGSDRCAEVAEKMEEDIIVNLQADEFLKEPDMVDELIHMLIQDSSIKMGTLKKEINSPEELWDRNVVKVVTDNDDCALYFSRLPIPHIRDRVLSDETSLPDRTFYKHPGIYAYRHDFLLLFGTLLTTQLEDLEKLEQLRAMEYGFKIKVKETRCESYRIDTPDDLRNLERLLIYGQGKD